MGRIIIRFLIVISILIIGLNVFKGKTPADKALDIARNVIELMENYDVNGDTNIEVAKKM